MASGLGAFQAAVAKAAKDIAPQYGLSPSELQVMLLTGAGLEGGLGETANVGDGGWSVGRYQFNKNGGVGATLKKQGYSDAQIADDEFQVQYFAPVYAKTLAAAKQAGFTGSQAIRQGIYNAERPAVIYDQGAFNNAFTQAHSMAGAPGSPDPGGTAVPSAAFKPGYDQKQADTLKKVLDDILAKVAKADDKTRPALLVQYQAAQQNYTDYMKAFTGPTADKPPAQQDFQNAIDLGDFNAKEAQSAYDRWAGTVDRSVAAAQTQIGDTQKRQDALAQTQLDSEKSLAPSLMPRNTVAGYSPDSTANIIDSYFKKYQGEAPGGPEDYQGNGGNVPPPVDLGDAVAGLGLPKTMVQPGQDVLGDFKKFATTPARGPIEQNVPHGISTGAAPNLPPPASTYRGTDPTGVGTSSVFNGVKRALTRPWWASENVPSYASGTANHPGGPAMVGERGTETMIQPGGTPQPVGAYGPEVVDMPPGTKVAPAGVPPQEAMMWAQIQDAAQKGPQQPDLLSQQRDAEMRANDPQLMEKVKASLRKAMSGLDALNPPTAPMPYGGAQDKFAAWRPLHDQIAQQQAQQAQPAPAAGR